MGLLFVSKLLTLVGALFLVWASDRLPSANSKASFDCGKAKTKIERTICLNSELGLRSLDQEVGKIFDSLKLKLSKETASKLLREQRQWIKVRNSCETDKDLPKCLEATYLARITELKKTAFSIPVETFNKNHFKIEGDWVAEWVAGSSSLKIKSCSNDSCDYTIDAADESSHLCFHKGKLKLIKNVWVDEFSDYYEKDCSIKVFPKKKDGKLDVKTEFGTRCSESCGANVSFDGTYRPRSDTF